jgi:signal transduction histidine kinase
VRRATEGAPGGGLSVNRALLEGAGKNRKQSGRITDHDLSFLVEATRLLANSLDVETTLATVARLSLPHFGSWCMVDLRAEDETRRLAIIHPDPAQQALANQLLCGWPPTRDSALGLPSVVRTRLSEVVFPVTDEMLVRSARSPENLAILRALEIGSFMTIPLLARGQVLGAITYVSPNHGDSFSAQDLGLAEDLASRCAIAIDNAHLVHDLREAKAAAESATLAKMRFLSTMSHELRTPLNAIAGYADLLASGIRGALTEPQLSDVRRIQVNEVHLLELVESVLDYASIDSGGIEFDLQDVELAQIMGVVAYGIVPLAEAKGITCLGFNAHDVAGIKVHADVAKLEQILINIASNAIKFSLEHGTIELTHELIGERVKLRMSDRGIGIGAEDQQRIFEPFLQLDAGLTRDAGGTGLGLAISRKLAAGMGGELTVESNPGRGSVFSLTLPQGRE